MADRIPVVLLTVYAQAIAELTVTLTSTGGVNYVSILYVSHSLLSKQDNALSEFEPVSWCADFKMIQQLCVLKL